MTGAAVGTEVYLYYDSPRDVREGDLIVVSSSGRTYLVRTVRVQQRGKHAGRRKHLRAVVVPTGTSPAAGAVAHPLHWYRRDRGRRRRQ